MKNQRTSRWLIVAFLIASISTLISVFVGEVAGQEPCSLCWYQRIFLFPMVWILGLACLRCDNEVWVYALPLTGAGGLFAIYHSLLFWNLIESDVPKGSIEKIINHEEMMLFGIVPLPALSVLTFAIIFAALLLVRRRAMP